MKSFSHPLSNSYLILIRNSPQNARKCYHPPEADTNQSHLPHPSFSSALIPPPPWTWVSAQRDLRAVWIELYQLVREVCLISQRGICRGLYARGTRRSYNRTSLRSALSQCGWYIDTYSSFKKAKDHPSVLSATLFASFFSLFSNVTPVCAPSFEILLSHLIVNASRSSGVGKLYVYLVSNREGLLMIASSISSGWFVLAMVRIPSFWAWWAVYSQVGGRGNWDEMRCTYQTIKFIQEERLDFISDHRIEVFQYENTRRIFPRLFEHTSDTVFGALITGKTEWDGGREDDTGWSAYPWCSDRLDIQDRMRRFVK